MRTRAAHSRCRNSTGGAGRRSGATREYTVVEHGRCSRGAGEEARGHEERRRDAGTGAGLSCHASQAHTTSSCCWAFGTQLSSAHSCAISCSPRQLGWGGGHGPRLGCCPHACCWLLHSLLHSTPANPVRRTPATGAYRPPWQPDKRRGEVVCLTHHRRASARLLSASCPHAGCWGSRPHSC